jgi:transcriptional regulator with XRE-family HTH domain
LIIGERLRALREYKALSQEDMEKRTGLYRYYVSRVENGHTIPTLETLNRFARALEVPVFHLVYEEGEPYQLPILPKRVRSREAIWKTRPKQARLLERFSLIFRRMSDRDRKLLFCLARKMVGRALRLHPAALAHLSVSNPPLEAEITDLKQGRAEDSFNRDDVCLDCYSKHIYF